MRRIPFGYYLADARRYGDYLHEVVGHTDVYHAIWKFGYEANTDEDESLWVPRYKTGLGRAHGRGFRIALALEGHRPAPPWRGAIRIAAPFWDRVFMVEVANEPAWGQASLGRRADEVRDYVDQLGLRQVPVGVTLAPPLGGNLVNSRVDWIGLEAYLEAMHQDREEGGLRRILGERMDAMRRRVWDAGKRYVCVMQAYSRSGNWTNERSLALLQAVTWDWVQAQEEPPLALLMFAYGRPDGARFCGGMIDEHLKIGEALLA